MNKIIIQAKVVEQCRDLLESHAQKIGSQLTASMKHFNIVLGGKTGAGKSTLINAFLQLDQRKEAETGIGEPITKKIDQYESKSVPTFRLWDNRGIELSQYGINAVVQDVNKLVDSQAKTKDLDCFIHAYWYCVMATGNRIEPIEQESLLKIAQIYDKSNLPVIVVLTQSYFRKNTQELQQKLSQLLPKNVDIVPVVATAQENIKSFGLDNLLKVTAKRASESIGSACFHSIKTQLQEEIKMQKEQLILKSNNNSQQMLLQKRHEIQKEEELNYMLNHLSNILEAILSPFLLLNHSRNFDSGTELLINDIQSNFRKLAQDTLNQFKESEILTAKKDLSGIYAEMHKKVELKTNFRLDYSQNDLEWQTEALKKIEQTLTDKSTNLAFELVASFLINVCMEIIANFFGQAINTALTDITTVLEEIAKKQVSKVTDRILAETLQCNHLIQGD